MRRPTAEALRRLPFGMALLQSGQCQTLGEGWERTSNRTSPQRKSLNSMARANSLLTYLSDGSA